jgi:hypothetical protein
MKTFILMATMLLSFGFAHAQCGDMVFKINNGELKKYTTGGAYQGTITRDVIDSDNNNDNVVVVHSNGDVKKYTCGGAYQGSITRDAKKVKINGDIIIVTHNNGDMKKYSFGGAYQGSI